MDIIDTNNYTGDTAEPMGMVQLPFSQAEYDQRLLKTRAAMAIQGIDVLIVSDPSNMTWLTGYDGWSFYVHQCVIVSMDQQPIWYGRAMDANGCRRTAYLHENSIHSYGDEYIQTPHRHPMDFLCQSLFASNNWANKRIGVEMDNYYFSAAAFNSLRQNLPDAKFIDATGLVNWQRAIKSQQEIEYMRIAAKIVENMHLRILEIIEPGIRKNYLAAQIYAAGLEGVDGFGGDYPAIVPMMPSGKDASAPHLTWNDEPIENNTGTFFELAGCYKRYHCPQSRTVYLGIPPTQFINAEYMVIEGIYAGLEQAKPGNTCADIANAFFAVMRRHGFEKTSRCGYSIGASYPPDWGERTMSLRPDDHTVLEPGMTFHFMPGIWLDDWGIEITESIHITATGAQTFCQTPRNLFIKN